MLFLKKIKAILYGTYNPPQYYNLFERFSSYKEDDVLNAFYKLSENDKNLLYKKFNNDLRGYNKLGRDECYKVRNILLKIERLLKRKYNSNGKIFADYFSNIDSVDLLFIINSLSEDKKSLIFKRFGKDLNELNPITRNETYKLYRIMVNIKTKINENNIVNIYVKYICTLLNKDYNFTKEEVIIFIFRIFLSENSPYDINTLTNYFNVSEEEINRITKTILSYLSDNDKVFYDDIINNRDSFNTVNYNTKGDFICMKRY